VEAHHNKAKAAKMLHIGYKTLYRKLREHHML
jgi:DNA-binding NtrC family response regulator